MHQNRRQSAYSFQDYEHEPRCKGPLALELVSCGGAVLLYTDFKGNKENHSFSMSATI